MSLSRCPFFLRETTKIDALSVPTKEHLCVFPVHVSHWGKYDITIAKASRFSSLYCLERTNILKMKFD